MRPFSDKFRYKTTEGLPFHEPPKMEFYRRTQREQKEKRI